MKKKIALLLAGLMTLGSLSVMPVMAEEADLSELIAAAQEEGELVVYGSCEEEYLAAAVDHFQELYNIKTSYQRLSTGEVYSKIQEEAGVSEADIFIAVTDQDEVNLLSCLVAGRNGCIHFLYICLYFRLCRFVSFRSLSTCQDSFLSRFDVSQINFLRKI